MYKNKAKRTIAMLLALLMSGANLLSCSESEVNAETESSAAAEMPVAGETETAEEETAITDEIREKYKDVSYGGATIKIAGFEPGKFFYKVIDGQMNEIMYPEQNGDIYVDAVFERNTNTEDLLDIKIEAEFVPYTDYGSVAKYLAKLVKSGDSSVDMGIGSLSENIVNASTNNFYNLRDIDSIEYEERWFDQNIVKNYSYRNRYLYTITGAHTIYDDYSVPTVYYDKTIMTKNQLEDPADLVMEGKWTIDSMMTMAETVVSDTNGDGEMTADADIYGFFDNGDIMPHIMEGTGNLKAKLGEDGIPYVNCLTSEYIDTAETVFHLIISSPAVCVNPTNGVTTAFKEGHALFAYELLAVINQYRDREEDFSILPLPKKDEAQESYVSPVNSVWCTSFVIPVSVAEVERAGTVMNVLNAMSMDTVNKGLYEQVLGAKLIREEKSLIMLDYILNCKQYCWANGYSWASQISSYCTGFAQNGTFVLASKAQKVSRTINKALEKFLASFDETIAMNE